MHIESVLFDADGVLQKPAEARRSAWANVLGRTEDLDSFLDDVFRAEGPALDGRSDFAEAFSEVISRWKCRGTLAEALDAWTMIEIDQSIADAIGTMREMCLRCYLATNQEAIRAGYMSRTLGYVKLFDGEFYSCRMGVAKPDVGYFQKILDELQVEPDSLLLLDDRMENVESARAAGLRAVEFTLAKGSDGLFRLLKEFQISVG